MRLRTRLLPGLLLMSFFLSPCTAQPLTAATVLENSTMANIQEYQFLKLPEGVGNILGGPSAPRERDSIRSTCDVSAENLTQQEHINYGRLAIIGGGLLTIGVVHQFYVQNAWWKDYRGPFHFREDLHYARNVDKVGHFYAGMLTSYLGGKAMAWSGFREEKALWYGAGLGTLFELYVEIQDGFSTLWGFDRVDFAADVAGAMFPVAKHYVPFLQNVDMKFSYLPSHAEPPRGGQFQNQKRLVVDDYEGQRFWLCFKVGHMLPDPLRSVWPDFLGIALGMGVRDLENNGGQLEWYIALDYDLTKLPGDSGFLKALKEGLNLIHLPSPAIRFSPSVILYGLYFSL
jgi:hypothetical protein